MKMSECLCKVKKGLECCSSKSAQDKCENIPCPYFHDRNVFCIDQVMKDALQIITDQETLLDEKQKHLENLQKVNEDLEERIAIMEEGTDNGWIPVTLGLLPEPNDSYFGRHIIVCDERQHVFPLRYVRRNIRGKTVERWQENDGRIYYGANIIAWQYLPEPLKVGEANENNSGNPG